VSALVVGLLTAASSNSLTAPHRALHAAAREPPSQSLQRASSTRAERTASWVGWTVADAARREFSCADTRTMGLHREAVKGHVRSAINA
jgi:hypothetical protein